ncbi:hypothetical protein D6810_00210 [Candidatus Dojkabacteria bacterium]|uniref:Uncharacterized protein n=1 Tax=Candidatus Dojkabacteria bacterium TaxID=2099670 RepID=A0A3M0Z058_9BACT|nr:MAG: hypothetical protein D6810_00210 [Candidatus Dojkabacteria bacterium]
MNIFLYSTLFLISLIAQITDIFGQIGITFYTFSFYISTIFLLFTSNKHPKPKPKDLEKLKNKSLPISEIELFDYFYRLDKRNFFVYILVTCFILLTLLYPFISSQGSSAVKIFITTAWAVIIFLYNVFSVAYSRVMPTKVICEYLIDILKIDISREKKRQLENNVKFYLKEIDPIKCLNFFDKLADDLNLDIEKRKVLTNTMTLYKKLISTPQNE